MKSRVRPKPVEHVTIEVEAIRLTPHEHVGSTPDYHEMVWLGEMEQRDSIGRRNINAWRLWAVILCNNPDCGSKGLVSMDSMTKALS